MRRQVSKALKLPKHGTVMTIQDHKDRIAHLRKMIMTGTLKGILLQRAHEYIRKAEYTIRILEKKKPKISTQMQLPTFTKQMDVVRIEELVAEKIAEQMIAAFYKNNKKAKAS